MPIAKIIKNGLVLSGIGLCVISGLSPLIASAPHPSSSAAVPLEEQEDYQDDLMGPSEERSNPQVSRQKAGDYPPLERPSSHRESIPLGAIQEVWDRADEGKGVYTVDYSPRDIIRLRLREYMTTTIALPQWERIKAYEIGDNAYEVKKIDSHTLNIRIMGQVGTDTNLTVFGHSGQIYVFYMRSEGYNSKNISDGIVYVQAPSRLIKEPMPRLPDSMEDQAQDYLEVVQSNPGELNFNYTMAGNPEIAPDRVYTDGQKTWFDYGERINRRDLPVIFNVVDGIDEKVNSIREGSKVVAFGTGKFSLQSGKKVVCVYPSIDKS